MTDHLPDAPVSTERLDQLIKLYREMNVFDRKQDTERCLRELKVLRERCERKDKALRMLNATRVDAGIRSQGKDWAREVSEAWAAVEAEVGSPGSAEDKHA